MLGLFVLYPHAKTSRSYVIRNDILHLGLTVSFSILKSLTLQSSSITHLPLHRPYQIGVPVSVQLRVRPSWDVMMDNFRFPL